MNRLMFCLSVPLLLFVITSQGYVLRKPAHTRAAGTESFNITNEKYFERKRSNRATDPGIVKRSLGVTTHVPQFMLDLYEHLLDRRWSPKFDVARSYSVVETRITGEAKQLYKIANFSDNDGRQFVTETKTIHFNVSHFPSNEILQMAQLRLYITAAEQKNLLSDVYATLVVSYNLANGKNVILPERQLEAQGDYWESFDVSDIFREWTKEVFIYGFQSLEIRVYKTISSGLEVELRPLSEKEPQILILSKMSSSTSLKRKKSNKEHQLARQKRSSLLNQPNANEDLKKLSSLQHVIVKRSEDDDEELEEQSNYIVEELGKPRKGKSKKRKNPCRRRSMKVNFAAIGYDQWIIAPPSYEAFECTGKCSFPMGSHLSPTKHAVIQTLMHSLEPKQVARACCVPTKLEPISVLYVDNDGTVTYKYEYNDMVVAECGCR